MPLIIIVGVTLSLDRRQDVSAFEQLRRNCSYFQCLEIWPTSCFASVIMNSKENTKSNSSLLTKPRALWFIFVALFAVTVMGGTQEVRRIQSSREWVTISLPNPPAPLPDRMAPGAVQTAFSPISAAK